MPLEAAEEDALLLPRVDFGVPLGVGQDLLGPEGDLVPEAQVPEHPGKAVAGPAALVDQRAELAGGRQPGKVDQGEAELDPAGDVLRVEGADHLAELDGVGVAAGLARG